MAVLLYSSGIVDTEANIPATNGSANKNIIQPDLAIYILLYSINITIKNKICIHKKNSFPFICNTNIGETKIITYIKLYMYFFTPSKCSI